MRRAGIAIAIIVAAVALLAWWLLRHGPPPPAVAATAAAARAASERMDAVAPAGGDSGARGRKKAVRDAAGAQELRREVQNARSQRLAKRAPAGSSGAGASAGAEPDPVLDKDYLRAQVRDIVPLVGECYQQALERDPKIEGTLQVRFTIGGEPGVGGVIESSEIVDDGSSIAEAELRQCVTETMYAIELEAPQAGGTVTVVYPFAFKPSGP